MECVDACPKGTFLKGTSCITCGAICDNSMSLYQIDNTNNNQTLVNGLFCDQNPSQHNYTLIGRAKEDRHTMNSMWYNK